MARVPVVGFSASFITRSDLTFRPHTFPPITAKGTFDHHDPRGDVLYGAEIVVHPGVRARGIGRRLYEARFQLARRLGLRYFVAGGRVPGYADAAGSTDINAYVRSVVEGPQADRLLTPQPRAGLTVAGVLPNYLKEPNSAGYATLLVWPNPDATSWRRRTPSASMPEFGADV